MPTRVEEPAPAKVNLTLHVTGRRADGYHLLDSLVVFVDIGERVAAERCACPPKLCVDGPLASGIPAGSDNLILRAAALHQAGEDARFQLWKTIPAAAGLGGGSSDAAAALRALSSLTDTPLPPVDRIAGLGADIPVCLRPTPQRMRGVGERLDPVPSLPDCALLLVNPGEAVSTGAVFAALNSRDNPPMEDSQPAWPDLSAFVTWLAQQRNDMEPAAQRLAPVIGDVLAALAASPGCRFARMSGSGASCFGLFATLAEAEAAGRILRQTQGWWAAAAPLLVS